MKQTVLRFPGEIPENPAGAREKFLNFIRSAPLGEIAEEQNVDQSERGDNLYLFRWSPGKNDSVFRLAVGKCTQGAADQARIPRRHKCGQGFQTAVADILKLFEKRTIKECVVRTHFQRMPGKFQCMVEFRQRRFCIPLPLPRITGRKKRNILQCGGPGKLQQ